MNIIILFIIIVLIFYIYGKNVILNFQRLTFGKLTGRSTINDYISYDLYTYLYMGNPQQKVFHFIEPHESVFQFKKQEISYNIKKFNNSIIDSQKDIITYFYPENSISYNKKDYFSENYLFNIYNSTDTIEAKDLKFTIYLNNRNDKEINGRIGLFTMKYENSNSYFSDKTSFIQQLKEKEIIDKNVFSFIYENNENIFNNKKEEKIIIGEYSYKFNSKINTNEEEKIYSYSPTSWSFLINEIEFNYNNQSFIEEQIELKFNFFSKFIKGSVAYNKNIRECFFHELIKLNLCKNEIISENRYSNQYEIYYCNNSKFVKQHIKYFPKLNFIHKGSGLVFTFTYKDLFKQFEDKIYFMIIFNYNKYITRSLYWEMGEIFLSKFIIDFDLDSKTISFYKNQVNNESNFISEQNNNIQSNDNNKKTNYFIQIIIEIIKGIIIIFCFYLIYRKYRKSRKIKANELEDSNYEYVPKENKNENKLIEEKI